MNDQLHADLDAAVRALDPRFRAALILVDVHDLSYSEAAAVMGVPVGTVMSRKPPASDSCDVSVWPRAVARRRRARGPSRPTRQAP